MLAGRCFLRVCLPGLGFWAIWLTRARLRSKFRSRFGLFSRGRNRSALGGRTAKGYAEGAKRESAQKFRHVFSRSAGCALSAQQVGSIRFTVKKASQACRS